MKPLPSDAYRDLVRLALVEDVGAGDITTEATVDPAIQARGVFIMKGSGVLAGLDVAMEAFRQLEPSVQIDLRKLDGEACVPGDEIAEVAGSAWTLLAAERTALNFLQRLSGIATETHRFVDAAKGRIAVLDTRKTTPTLRALEKYAVVVGGGVNHRMGLFDAILIKDNHIRIAGSVREAVSLVRRRQPELPIELEAQTLEEVDEALRAGVDVVLADNMSVDDIRETVRRARGRAKVEISGGVKLQSIEELASTGADYVSAGALTHSAAAVDISFEIEPIRTGTPSF